MSATKVNTYRVRLTREATESCDITIDAETADEAESKALISAGRYGEDLGDVWDIDEGNMHEVWVTDVTRIKEP